MMAQLAPCVLWLAPKKLGPLNLSAGSDEGWCKGWGDKGSYFTAETLKLRGQWGVVKGGMGRAGEMGG